MGTSMREFQKLDHCIECCKSFTEENPFFQQNRHQSCQSRFRYRTNEKYRKMHHKCTMKWQKEHPEQNKLIQNRASKKYQKSHREQIAKKRMERYHSDPLLKEYLLESYKQRYVKLHLDI